MTMPASQPVDYVAWLNGFDDGLDDYEFPEHHVAKFRSLVTQLTALREAVKEARKFLDIDTREPGAVWPVVPDMMRHRAALVALYHAADLLTHTDPTHG